MNIKIISITFLVGPLLIVNFISSVELQPLASRINLNNCRISPRNNFIRCNWIPFIAVILISLVTEVLFAQTMILKPPSVQDSDGDYEIKLLLKQGI